MCCCFWCTINLVPIWIGYSQLCHFTQFNLHLQFKCPTDQSAPYTQQWWLIDQNRRQQASAHCCSPLPFKEKKEDDEEISHLYLVVSRTSPGDKGKSIYESQTSINWSWESRAANTACTVETSFLVYYTTHTVYLFSSPRRSQRPLSLSFSRWSEWWS